MTAFVRFATRTLHTRNAFEENQPVARYWVERVKEEGVVAVECNHARVAGLRTAGLNDVIELTTVMLTYVDDCLCQEKARLLEIVRRMPLDKVLTGTQKAFAIDESRKIGKRRKK
jgi:hypothetical protein